MSKTYFIYPKILKGFTADLWQTNRRKVLKDNFKGCQIDGIDDKRRYIHTWTATPNLEILKDWEVLTNWDKAI